MSGELFLELLCEELPAAEVAPALAGLERGLLGLLEGLEHGAVRRFSTPRRLALCVEDVAEGRPAVERLVTGPPAERAVDADGAPTKAGIGFARGRGLEPSALERVATPKGELAAVRVREGGERTVELLAAGLDALVRSVPFQRTMEWGAGGVKFGRPLHRVNVLYAGQVVSGEAAGLAIGNRTLGHRLAREPEFEFRSTAQWREGLLERSVEPDAEVRRERIRTQLDELASELEADPIVDEDLLAEVTQLVEWPVPVVGTFDDELLALPPRLLVESMRVHQRYFPVHQGSELTHRFVVITNNPFGNGQVIAEGNARVLRARFDDAKFFLGEDQSRPLEQRDGELAKMQWIRGLGTMLERAHRVADLGAELAPLLGADVQAVRRAGRLCKSDLPTLMVGEFPELQGHMGRLYALHQGEPEEVAAAIEEHYLPRFAGDSLPGRAEGTALALADRVDVLTCCFGIGMSPRGSGDPQGLRRAAQGLMAIVVGRGLRLDLGALFEQAILHVHARALSAERGFEAWRKERGEAAAEVRERDALRDQLVEFVLARVQAAAVGSGLSGDVVDAVRAVSPPDLLVLERKLAALRGLAGTERFLPILTTFKRVLNITREAEGELPARDELTESVERELFDALERVRDDVERAAAKLDYELALAKVLELEQPVAALFDSVMVEDPDPVVRSRRIGLLLAVGRVFLLIADFSRISTR